MQNSVCIVFLWFIIVSPEPVVPSPSLLIAGMRDVESDWSVPRATQTSTNQLTWQIQVVNPDPASDCTARSSRFAPLESIIFLTNLARLSPLVAHFAAIRAPSAWWSERHIEEMTTRI